MLLPVCFIVIQLFSQNDDLLLRSGSKGLFIEHNVQPKEGLYPIGRMYNVNPKFLAAFNQWDMSKGLSIGQVIQVPLTDTNFTQSGNSGVPVYYRAAEKEGLSSVSKKNNNISASQLKAWNQLGTDQVNAGQKLIVGFLVTNEMQDRVVTIKTQQKPTASEKKTETAQVKTPDPEVKKEEPVKAPEPKAEEKKKEVPVETEKARTRAEEKFLMDKYGYFAIDYNKQAAGGIQDKEQTVTSSIFKTVSGWADSKFYLLINDVEPGTIVKVTNPGNNKVIYAKVLYSMEKIRQNQGVDMRISDAAASFLSIYETDKFILQVSY